LIKVKSGPWQSSKRLNRGLPRGISCEGKLVWRPFNCSKCPKFCLRRTIG
jgi:hypothetical protein